MRDPKRIDKVLNVIKLVWSECPDLRLMQLLLNSKLIQSICESGEKVISAESIFNIEDEELMKAIAEYGLEFVKDETEDKLLVESGMLDDLIKEAKNEKSRSLKDSLSDWKKELEEI